MKANQKSNIELSQLTIYDIKAAALFTDNEKTELLALLNKSYPHFTIENIFNNYSCFDQLYVYRMYLNKTLVASRQFLLLDEFSDAPAWALEMNNLLQAKNYAIGSRAIVHPSLRGQGLGKFLVKKINKELFSSYKANIILGQSTNLTAISLYLQHGANLWKGDISDLSTYQKSIINNKMLSLFHKQSNLSQTRLKNPIRYYYQKRLMTNSIKLSHALLSEQNMNKSLNIM